jgi:molybdopterin-containing oxidoreductase family iron-sulfur binding subunit
MEGRDLARSWAVEEYAGRSHAWDSHGEASHGEAHGHELHTLYRELEFPGEKWGMAIDLSACVGCSACTVACQSENNIPVVGPEQVIHSREMHWIRIDRYYEGDPSAPRTVHQPVLCQQCDNAPCETVCPVNATTHSEDGLNQMTYNRCVGTRYCANNCPYKVRRFNFFDYTATKREPETLALNPEVTVRPRGVMEKCTFCVQRIQDVRFRAKAEDRPVRDGEIRPACAVACPARAIVFGNLNDPGSEVSRLSASDRGYKLLEELGARPAITYLARVTNPAGDGGSR